MPHIQKLAQAVVDGRIAEIENIASLALESGLSPVSIIKDGLMAGMNEVGRKFKIEEMYIPEVLLSSETAKLAIKKLGPHIQKESQAGPPVVIGTVKGDLHDVGKNLAAIFLESAGFRIIDLGVDVDEKDFQKALGENQAGILGLSAMLTTTMVEMGRVIDYLKLNPLSHPVKIYVAGAPVNAAFARQIGADGYASDASEGVALVKSFTEADCCARAGSAQ